MTAPALDYRVWGTVEDIAAEVGLSPWTLREKCRRLEWPHRKPSGCRRVLINRDEVSAFLDGAPLTVKKLPGGGRVVKPAKGVRA